MTLKIQENNNNCEHIMTCDKMDTGAQE